MVLLDMVDRAPSDVSLTALETLREFDPSLFTEEQRRRVLSSIQTAQAQPISRLHHLVLGEFLARLRADDEK